MQRNIDEALQHDDHVSEAEGTADQHDEPNACIESIDNDNATDPEICKMEKTNSLGKIFQRLKSGNKNYHLYNASNMGKLDDPVVAPDSIDGNAKFSELEKSNSLGKMFQKMRPSKKVQQKRPSSAVSGTSAKGSFFTLFYHIVGQML